MNAAASAIVSPSGQAHQHRRVGRRNVGEPAVVHAAGDRRLGGRDAALRRDSPYNFAHKEIQDEFGGIEPLIIVAEAKKPGAMRLPHNVKIFEKFQRFLERDPEVGASFSFVDVITTMAVFVNEGEPKWGVVPTDASRVSFLFGAFFQGTSYAETARFMDPDFNNTALFFYCRNHRGADDPAHHRARGTVH